MRPTVLFCAALLTWFGVEPGNTHARLTLGTFPSVNVSVMPHAAPPTDALRDRNGPEFERIAQTPNMLTPDDPAERAWAAVQNTTDRAALEDFIRRFGNTRYAKLALVRLIALIATSLPHEDAAAQAWAAAQNTTDRAALEGFIQLFGDTRYADPARARLGALTANKLPPEDAAARAWAAVQNTTDPATLGNFIRRYGNTKYADRARARLGALAGNKLPAEDAAARAWAAVQNTNDPAALQDFIRRYGNTKYGDRARARLAALNANRRPPEDPAGRAWAKIQNTTDPAALKDFIRRFGNSAYAILARARLAELASGTPEQVAAFIRECDRLAANPDDPARRSGASGIRWDLLDPTEALPPCQAATKARPNDARLMYQMGRVLDKQGASTEALSWYRKAADSGYLEALNNLGIMYTNGRGVERNDREALRLFRKAVDGGSADGLTNLGFMYHHGRGVAANLEEAARFFAKPPMPDRRRECTGSASCTKSARASGRTKQKHSSGITSPPIEERRGR